MNLPPGAFKRIPAERLREFSADCLKAAGMKPDHAEQLVVLLTNGDLRGVRSHGTRQVRGYCQSLRDEKVNPNPDIRVVKETETSILVDGDGGLGYAPMMMATDQAIEKPETGVWRRAPSATSATTARPATTFAAPWKRAASPFQCRVLTPLLGASAATSGPPPPTGGILPCASACPERRNRPW
ncbi:MAG TPA: hypothetical protein EYM39_03630 [Candidatus Latescibacteria bacterium]|nr:hypothetical protein [Candidatus Latescibacterota bacterium]